ncbi:MAG TPA: ATP-dependent DNA helicase RecG [Solirubrobacteraceae bacterium]|jgi:ATP-dependent DNA helicase RecG|nr:ATP-dependent DNA helicase RecG [Solirubrobacteraceae bacterium]
MPATSTQEPEAERAEIVDADPSVVRISGGGLPAFGETRALDRAEMLAAPVRWPRPQRLAEPLELPGGKVAEGMRALGLNTVGELLEHLPRDSREARTVANLRADEQATVAVRVRAIAARPVRRRGMRPLVEATVHDETGSMRVTFFNQPWLVQRYPPGTSLLLHGKADARGGFRVSHHALGSQPMLAPAEADTSAEAQQPESESASSPPSPAAPPPASREQAGAVAHYPATEGVSSTQILTLVQGARDRLADVCEPLPALTRAQELLPDRPSALAAMHFPRDAEDTAQGRSRLAFDELLLTQLVFLLRRARRREHEGAPALCEAPELSTRWLEQVLPFSPTGDQRRAIAEIDADIAGSRAMQRLLMGEVGSGKTVVALYAMLRAVEHGAQAALMAPTETLAEQHFATIQRLLGAENVACALLTGSTTARMRRDTLGKLASGECSLLVGTHALIEPDVEFRSLAVAVVDEQHRFGVRQRAALHEKGTPHMLHMTATPIPRTLALARYGDLETSTLHELPAGRQPIDTRIVAGERARARAYEELREQLRAGRQAFVVCPLIEQQPEPAAAGAAGSSAGTEGASSAGAGRGGLGELRAATAELERLRKGELQGYELVLLHGGMRPREKQEAMAAFASGRADVLVATTVIEVGIDVPNATVMLVENAERFGISQLHQLRGRIGRGEHRASCRLMGPPGSARLRALAEHSDGFRLAEIDLELRSEGELVGLRQSGIRQFTIAELPKDAELLERARACARALLEADPQLGTPENALLGRRLREEFGEQALEPIPA